MRRASAPIALALAASLAALGAAPAAAQDESAASESPLPVQKAPISSHGPDDENALSRFGIVALGSFPIMLLYSDFSFDIGRYIANGFNADYAPWPFKSEFSEQPSDAEKGLRIGVAVGASLAVGAIDYLVRQSKAKKERLRREALLEYAADKAREDEIQEAPPGVEPLPRPQG